VPFHMWTPDAYDGAPTPVTAYMSVIPKVAGFAAIIRILIQGLGPLRDDWHMLIAILALVTMAFGNIVAISQRNVKRMLAYSSIAHTGYAMVGLAAYEASAAGFGSGSTAGVANSGVSSLLYYMFAYTFMNIGAFAVVAWIQHRGSGMMLDDFAGLASRQPLAAIAMTVFMVSLMGIPPLIGFYAKYYIILAAIEADLLWLAIAVVLASAISAYFYLRVVATMYFTPAPDEAAQCRHRGNGGGEHRPWPLLGARGRSRRRVEWRTDARRARNRHAVTGDSRADDKPAGGRAIGRPFYLRSPQ
jgi:NADH-quinone oxidoreductase subunit N